jgi:hypothetical protein
MSKYMIVKVYNANYKEAIPIKFDSIEEAIEYKKELEKRTNILFHIVECVD